MKIYHTICDDLSGNPVIVVESNNGVNTIKNKAEIENLLEPLKKPVRIHDLLVHTAGFIGTIYGQATGILASGLPMNVGGCALEYANYNDCFAKSVVNYPDKLGIMGFQPGESFAYDAGHLVLTGFLELVYNLKLNPAFEGETIDSLKTLLNLNLTILNIFTLLALGFQSGIN